MEIMSIIERCEMPLSRAHHYDNGSKVPYVAFNKKEKIFYAGETESVARLIRNMRYVNDNGMSNQIARNFAKALYDTEASDWYISVPNVYIPVSFIIREMSKTYVQIMRVARGKAVADPKRDWKIVYLKHKHSDVKFAITASQDDTTYVTRLRKARTRINNIVIAIQNSLRYRNRVIDNAKLNEIGVTYHYAPITDWNIEKEEIGLSYNRASSRTSAYNRKFIEDKILKSKNVLKSTS